MHPLEGNPIDLSQVLTWPQAIVAVVVVAALVVWPGWLNYLNAKAIKTQLQPNSGSSMRDAVDRTEQQVTEMRAFMEESRVDRQSLHGLIKGLPCQTGHVCPLHSIKED